MISEQSYLDTSPPRDEQLSGSYLPCEQCGAPLDEAQRYCLHCGARRKHASDPAARFLAAASRRQKGPARVAVPTSRGGSISVFTLGAILLIPLALAVGVLVGRGASSGSPDARLLSALSSQRASGAGAVASGSGSPSSSGSTAAGQDASLHLVTGSWTRSSGYAIQLASLPHGSSPAAAARIEKTDQAKGIKSVGVLATSAYHITPAPSGAYVIYSGSYATAGQADGALAALKRKVPGARVIHVVIPAAAASNTPVVAHTQYGTAHSAVGYKPTSQSLAKGAQVAAQDAKSTGKQASGAGLPDVVAVP